MEHSLVQMTDTRGYKTNVNKFNKTENIPAISSDHSGMTLENNNIREDEKFTNM